MSTLLNIKIAMFDTYKTSREQTGRRENPTTVTKQKELKGMAFWGFLYRYCAWVLVLLLIAVNSNIAINSVPVNGVAADVCPDIRTPGRNKSDWFPFSILNKELLQRKPQRYRRLDA